MGRTTRIRFRPRRSSVTARSSQFRGTGDEPDRRLTGLLRTVAAAAVGAVQLGSATSPAQTTGLPASTAAQAPSSSGSAALPVRQVTAAMASPQCTHRPTDTCQRTDRLNRSQTAGVRTSSASSYAGSCRQLRGGRGRARCAISRMPTPQPTYETSRATAAAITARPPLPRHRPAPAGPGRLLRSQSTRAAPP